MWHSCTGATGGQTRVMRELFFLLVLVACGAEADAPIDVVPAEPAPCEAPPATFTVSQSGELVRVSKGLGGVFVGGATLHAEIRAVYSSALPATVDFGAEVVEVRSDLTLCLVGP